MWGKEAEPASDLPPELSEFLQYAYLQSALTKNDEATFGISHTISEAPSDMSEGDSPTVEDKERLTSLWAATQPTPRTVPGKYKTPLQITHAPLDTIPETEEDSLTEIIMNLAELSEWLDGMNYAPPNNAPGIAKIPLAGITNFTKKQHPPTDLCTGCDQWLHAEDPLVLGSLRL